MAGGGGGGCCVQSRDSDAVPAADPDPHVQDTGPWWQSPDRYAHYAN